MAKNLSVEQFKQLMANIPPAVAKELEGAVREQAERLADAMRMVVPEGKDETRELKQSIRVEDGRHPLRKVVRAGGPLTTKPVKEGFDGDYDYAIAQEFGNSVHKPHPFFWPTYRLMKSKLRSGIARKIKPAIAKVVKVE